jgi:hypothetical protein
MSQSLIATIVGAAATGFPAVVALLREQAGGRQASAVRQKLDIADRLDPTSPARARLLQNIDRSVFRWIESDENFTREPAAFFVALFLIAGGVVLLLNTTHGRWYLIPAAVFLLAVGSYGAVDSAVKKQREPKPTSDGGPGVSPPHD